MLLLYSDEEVNRFLPWFPIKTWAEMERYWESCIAPCYRQEQAYNYAITLQADHRVIGYVYVGDIGGSNDLGYALRREFWHRGITSEACAAVVKQLRADGLPYVTATHDVNNPNSGKVMQKLGMTYRYSYREMWMPKKIEVVFRMYQLDLNGTVHTYKGYHKKWGSFVEQII